MLQRILVPLLMLLSTLGVALAQDGGQDFDRAFQEGINALQQGRLDDGIKAFHTCLELQPEHSASAYNIACGYSLKQEKDPAFEWLTKAADWGFGDIGENIALAERDPDLANVRTDPRYPEFIEGMRERKRDLDEFRESLESYWSKPDVYIPEAIAESEAMPLLVVLHDRGGRKEDVIKGRWKRIADELGTALLAPSGKYALSRKPQAGMSWFDTLEGYSERYWTFERTVSRAVNAFKKEHPLDKQRIFLAGEGQGAMVAFNVGITGPGLYTGVLGLNGIPHLQLAEPRGETAGRMGFRTHLLFERGAKYGLPTGMTPEAMAGRLAATLDSWGVAHRFEHIERSELGDLTTDQALVAALRALARENEPDAKAPVK